MGRIREHLKYTVYDNHTDQPVIVCGTANECASAMGVSVKTFYAYLSPTGIAREKRWEIIKEGLCGELSEPNTIGQYMQMCRLKKGMRITKLSRLTGIAKNLLRAYEDDKTFAGLMNLISIADVLNVSIDELIGRSKNASQTNSTDTKSH